MSKAKRAAGLLAAATEIQQLRFTGAETFEDLRRHFLRICKRHGVEWGTPVKGGRQGATAEWVACSSFFERKVTSELALGLMLGGAWRLRKRKKAKKKAGVRRGR